VTPQPFDQELLRARHAAVVTVALDRLLAHGRRGVCGPLFNAALAELGARLARCQNGGSLPGLRREQKAMLSDIADTVCQTVVTT